MKYQQSTFTLPVSSGKMTDLEYKFRVGLLSEEEFRKLVELKNASSITETTKSNGYRSA